MAHPSGETSKTQTHKTIIHRDFLGKSLTIFNSSLIITRISRTIEMPEFIFIELPSFQVRHGNGTAVYLSFDDLGLMMDLYHEVRKGLESHPLGDMTALLSDAGGQDAVAWQQCNSNKESEARCTPNRIC
jgi:hypothetical protein